MKARRVPPAAMVRWWLGCLVLIMGGSAEAQERPTLRAHRIVLEGGVVWSGGYAIGDASAQLRSNAPGSAPPPFTLFSASAGIERAASVNVRVGFTLTPQLMLEGGGSFGMPRVGVAIAQDTEAGAARVDGEQLNQYLFDAAVLWHLPLRLSPRVRPFVIGGAGYLRQLHEERTMVETGQVYYGGVGARYWIRGGAGKRRGLGVRADVRAQVRRGGIDFKNQVRVFPAFAAHLFLSL